MLLILVIILLLLGSSVVGSIYSNFMVFYSNFFESENYHKAYYASISALERGELVTKQRQPGYIGSGGFIMGVGTGSQYNSDGGSDKSLSGFSYLGNNENQTSVFRSVNSRTTRIPANGKGDIEWTLSYEDADNPNNPDNSNNYNKMDYENSEVFLLYYDNSADNPYVKGTTERSNISEITGEIRLPALLKSGFGYLNTGLGLVGAEGNLVDDDAIVDRQIRGNSNNTSFTIYSTQNIYPVFNGSRQTRKVTYDFDSVFRESDINNKLKFKFGEFYRSPINNRGNNIGRPTIISQKENDIFNTLGSNKFQSIFTNPQFKNLNLRFSLLNFLQGKDSNVYPFLEYYADFGTIVPDKYYTIDGEGNFKDYQINTIIQKPTVKETVLGNFTSIFG